MKLADLVQTFDLTVVGDVGDLDITGVAPLDKAGPTELSFLSNPKYKSQVATSQAGAILIKEPQDDVPAVQLVCGDPYAMLARIMQKLYPEEQPVEGGFIHPTALIHESVHVGENAMIGAFCTVGANTTIGDGAVLVSNVSIGADCIIGADAKLFPNVVLYPNVHLGARVRIHANSAIGADGFGYAFAEGRHNKVPQIGGVRIGDDVEIGANTTVDRGALSDTIIGEGTKIDNMVQIGHGVVTGKHCIIVSQTGISGSVSLGDYVVLAGKVGVVGHLSIGDRITVMGDSVVTKSLTEPGYYAGNPAIPQMQYKRQVASVRNIPKLMQRLKQLEEASSHD